jgi:ParB family chromosome partitioning protein
MALEKNKTGIMAAITAAVEEAEAAPQTSDANTARAHRTLPKGTVGSVRAGLGGIQEIDTALIIAWGPQDRLELTAVNSTEDAAEDLISSIEKNGQQVPVLLRPADHADGKFEVIYGRRRILACAQLGRPVKALIRTLDDSEALIAKGLENATRLDLSFYERARFAMAIMEQGHSREEVLQALSISKNTLSQLERVGRLVPDQLGLVIGPAYGAGRPKWMALAQAFDEGKLNETSAMAVLDALPHGTGSDARLLAVLASITKRGVKQSRPVQRSPIAGTVVKTTKSSITLSVKRAGRNKKFGDWFEENIDELLEESYRKFKNEGEG